MSAPVVTSTKLSEVSGLCLQTLKRERKFGRLAGEKRAGVKGYVYTVKEATNWLSYKGLQDKIALLS
jgi:hypothetical protein